VTRAGWDLVHAISCAFQVLGFLELPEDDVPPEEFWGSEERLAEWFEGVKARHDAQAKGLMPIEDFDEDATDMTGNEMTQQYH
jgi:hypothetical protein